VVETLFNVIMPLSLKFLIDDALGEEDFQALYTILGVLAAAGIITSIVAVWYERWDARLAAGVGDCGGCGFAAVRARPGFAVGLFCPHQARRDPLALFPSTFRPLRDRSRVFANSAALPFLELIAGIVLMLFLNWQLAVVSLLVFPITLIGPRILTPKAVAGQLRAEAQ